MVANNATELAGIPLDSAGWWAFRRALAPDGAGGCWCSYFVLPAADFKHASPDQREDLMRRRVDDGGELGVIGYLHGEPVGWVAVAPLGDLARLRDSQVARCLRDWDQRSTWVVSCFHVVRECRRRGLEGGLLKLALQHAWERSADAVVGMPIDGRGTRLRADERYHGDLNVFLHAGFELLERPTPRRCVVALSR